MVRFSPHKRTTPVNTPCRVALICECSAFPPVFLVSYLCSYMYTQSRTTSLCSIHSCTYGSGSFLTTQTNHSRNLQKCSFVMSPPRVKMQKSPDTGAVRFTVTKRTTPVIAAQVHRGGNGVGVSFWRNKMCPCFCWSRASLSHVRSI